MNPNRNAFSFEGRIVASALLALVVCSWLASWLGQFLEPWWLSWLVGLVPAIVLLSLLIHRTLRPSLRLFGALSDGVSSLKDSDFSVSIAADRNDELGQLVHAYNELGDVLRNERQSLYQRELLLDTVIQTTPSALVLTNDLNRIVYSNSAARQLFTKGKPLNGHDFLQVLEPLEAAFTEAVSSDRNGLFTVEGDEPETYHLSFSRFALNTQPHKLYLFKQLTHEISRQEVSTWKKVIRVISHELNNSLAPISSLAHSGKLISETPNPERLDSIFSTIEERANHLKRFIEGYARFARLPSPRIEPVDWSAFIESLRDVHAFSIVGELPRQAAHFDPSQMSQVLINLLKNAHESDSPEDQINVAVMQHSDGFQITVTDRGTGMSETVLGSALLPFYSTKQSGTGLGLPLCREIVEAHGGRLSLSNRGDGGLAVSIWLPLA